MTHRCASTTALAVPSRREEHTAPPGDNDSTGPWARLPLHAVRRVLTGRAQVPDGAVATRYVRATL